MRILFLILARGGSKGIPRKNLLEISGISLIGYKAIAAKKSKYCDRLIISTDSEEIRENALQYGAEAPFSRPAKLASDEAASEGAIWHAMDHIEKETGDTYDAVMLLEPTSPFARALDLDLAAEMMIQKNALAIIGVRETRPVSAFIGPLDDDGRITQIIDKMKGLRLVRRQSLAPEYTPNGALFLFNWEYFRLYRNIYHDRERVYGYVMPNEYSVDIDEYEDYLYAQCLVSNGLIDLSHWSNTA